MDGAPDTGRSATIKNAIRKNFDASADNYEEFENKTRLFTNLTMELVMETGIAAARAKNALEATPEGLRIADVGCGTGISSLILANLAGPDGMVTGLDLSPGMLEKARKKALTVKNVRFVEGDAESLDEHFVEMQDAVLYNACIFLLPDAQKSLRAAYVVLKEGGVVGMNFISGSFVNGQELFTQLLPEWTNSASASPRFPCDTSQLETMVTEAGFSDIHSGRAELTMSLDGLRRFYSVPAQSASLYPKQSYEQRRESVEKLFSLAADRGITKAQMQWKWITGRK